MLIFLKKIYNIFITKILQTKNHFFFITFVETFVNFINEKLISENSDNNLIYTHKFFKDYFKILKFLL